MKSYKFKINGNQYNVEINSISRNIADVTVNGIPYQVEMADAPAAPATPVSAPAAALHPAAKPAPSGAVKAVKSPLPGVILSINVNVGDAVKVGQTVAVLEAMKMENEIQAEFDGTVTAINVAKGDSILEGALIVTLR